MKILAIESSCDETAAAIVEDGRKILSNCVASQVPQHQIYGGVVPEIASRLHLETIYALTDRALEEAKLTRTDLDAIAVTYAPGLIGALLVGVNFAKAAALAAHKPLIPVHHLRGHIAANYLAAPDLEPPFVCLVASGGNTVIVEVRDYTDFLILGSTRDDAAGESFDKVARTMGMPYPGGASIEQHSAGGDPRKYTLPDVKVSGSPMDMSFSGLKTAAINILHHAEQTGEEVDVASFCASFSRAVSDILVPRTMEALRQTGCKKLAVAGGVAANAYIRAEFEKQSEALGAKLYLPPRSLCGDNAAMIGAQAYYEYLAGNLADQSLNAYATMPISELTI